MKKSKLPKGVGLLLFIIGFIVVISGFAAGLSDSKKEEKKQSRDTEIEKVELDKLKK
ncbi:MAG: hypothetical protein ABFS35_20890 [Bacteroidota bacterium]